MIVVSWNTRELLRQCLKSVVDETTGVSYELICVDNASGDGSADMVRSCFPNVKLIENRENRRFVLANNQAIRVAAGRYVLLLNSDTIVLDNAIGTTVRYADEHPEAAAFGCKVMSPTFEIQRSCFMVPSVVNTILAATYLNRLFPRSRFFGRQLMTWWGHDGPREVEAVSGCFSLVRKAAIDEVGLMDPIYYFYGDDIDWCYRFRSAGWTVRYLPQACIVHLGGQSSRYARRAFRLQLFGSSLVFMRLHRGTAAFLAARVGVALNFLLRLLGWLLQGVLRHENRGAHLEAAGTCLLGFGFALFAWHDLVMNRRELRRRLSTLRGVRALQRRARV